MIRKQNYNTQPERREEQSSSDSTEENGNRNEETQHGPSQCPSHIGNGQENGKELNKRIRWSREEMKEVVLFHIHQTFHIERELHGSIYIMEGE